MNKVIRSHPVVGSRKLQAPFHDGEGRSRTKQGAPGQASDPNASSTKRGFDDELVRLDQNDPAFEGTVLTESPILSPALFDELKQQLDAESSVRTSLELEVANLKTQLELLKTSVDDEKSRGYEQGLVEGRETAEKEAKIEIAHQYDKVTDLVNLFEKNLDAQIDDAEKLAIEITFGALCKIVGERYADDAFRLATIENVIASLKDLNGLTVYVSPSDMAVVSSLPESTGRHDVRFVADDRVTRGGCIVESSAGSWDGRLETQIQRLKESLVSVIKSDEQGV